MANLDTFKETEKKFLNYLKKISSYEEALGLMFWDLRTGAPKKGAFGRSEAIGTLSEAVFHMSVSDEMRHYIDVLSSEEAKAVVSPITRKAVEEAKKDYELNKKIPREEYRDYVILRSKAETVWEEAKPKGDFAMFSPYLKEIIDYKRRFVEYWGYKGHKYNTLLDQYEPGVTVDVIDRVFGELRDAIVSLLQEIQESGREPEQSFLFFPFPKEKQRAFSLEILKEIGYDFEAGRLDETLHPFATGLNIGDVRITTKYDENDFRTAIFGTIHEGGHALYEQNISQDLAGTNLCSGTSMGIHESQSLFWEKFIGKNRSFWKRHFSTFKKYAGNMFHDISLDAFYRAINVVRPSLIRIEADEMTYPLHIIVRYEIEKEIFSGNLEVDDLPAVWNEKMKTYLGVTPRHDGEGVLQDVHWSGGSFGYFPSYALGYIYAAQIKEALLKEISDFDLHLEEGNFAVIRRWLTKHIHQYGKMKKPVELLRDITGGGLNARPLIHYLEEKYRNIYQI